MLQFVCVCVCNLIMWFFVSLSYNNSPFFCSFPVLEHFEHYIELRDECYMITKVVNFNFIL